MSTTGTTQPFAKVTLISFGLHRPARSIHLQRLLAIVTWPELTHWFSVHLRSSSTSSLLLGLLRIPEATSEAAPSCSSMPSICSLALTVTMALSTARTRTSGLTYLFSCNRVQCTTPAYLCSTMAIILSQRKLARLCLGNRAFPATLPIAFHCDLQTNF